MPRDAVSRTANVERTGRHNSSKRKRFTIDAAWESVLPFLYAYVNICISYAYMKGRMHEYMHVFVVYFLFVALQGWKNSQRLPEELKPLGMMGEQLRGPLNCSNKRVLGGLKLQ